jgi:hypothetical protein
VYTHAANNTTNIALRMPDIISARLRDDVVYFHDIDATDELILIPVNAGSLVAVLPSIRE